MPKFFPSITHAIVKTPRDADVMARMGGAIAMVRLCFLDDNDYILMRINKMEGPTSGVVADVPSFDAKTNDGRTVSICGFAGKVSNEIKLEALLAFDKVKQKFGIKFGKVYKVSAKDIQEIGDTSA